MADVLLTGATGFVGRHVLKELEGRGHRVTVVARPGWERRIAIAPERSRVIETNDLCRESHDWWCRALEGIDVAIHAAWCAEPGSYLTSPRNLDCLNATLVLAKAAAEEGVKRFVGLGTCIEYEMSPDPLTTESPLAPTTPYSGAKVAAFFALREWFRQTDVSFLWCRLFHLYGEGEHPGRLVPTLHDKLGRGEVVDLSSGTQIRDFIAVEQAANMIVDGAFGAVQGAANICSSNGRSVRALAEGIADGYGRRDLLNFGARPDNLVDPPAIVGVPTKML